MTSYRLCIDNVFLSILLCMAGLRGTVLSQLPPVALPAFIGTIRPSDCLLLLCTPSLVVMHTTTDTLRSGSRRLSPVDAASLYDMADFQPRGAQLGSTFSMET